MSETALGVQVVPIALHHVPGFHACIDAVARERRFIAQVEAPPIERLQQFVQETLAKDGVQFVAVTHDDQVVGWADVMPYWQVTIAHRAALGMGLVASHRGQGLGRRLLQACIDKARRQGITRIELEARADNTRAIRLYEALGFQHEARMARGMRFDGSYFDTVSMGLMLDAAP